MDYFKPGVYVNEYGSIAIIDRAWAICVSASIYFNGESISDTFEVFVDGGNARFYFEDSPGHLQKFDNVPLHLFQKRE